TPGQNETTRRNVLLIKSTSKSIPVGRSTKYCENSPKPPGRTKQRAEMSYSSKAHPSQFPLEDPRNIVKTLQNPRAERNNAKECLTHQKHIQVNSRWKIHEIL